MWGFEERPVLENVHTNVCKCVLGVGKHVSGNAILAECGRCGLYVDYYIKCAKYWCKLLRLTDDRYPNNVIF